MTRYQRQMILPEVGQDGQKRLAKAHVLVVGAGGLGCPALQYLTGAGVGRITLIDPDHVEESNLHRQPLYRMSDLGQPKALAARVHLFAANPDIEVEARVQAIHPDLAEDLVSIADVVIDAADSFAVSYILSDACQHARVPLVSASALGQTGYVGGFCGDKTPSLRAVFSDLPERGGTCASAGVLGPVVGMIGALQAQITLQIILQQDPSPMGRMVTLDLKALQFGGFTFHKAPEPETALPFLSRDALRPEDQVVELRSSSEAPESASASAQRMKVEDIETYRSDTDRRMVLCCTSGLRAWRAASRLRAIGHRNLALLAMSACE
ncbi:Molybdopterin-synthase adenylyltransferase [Roseovarius albus]|uniref:Molybdopterin-synthase adenylyltransferase n=1 Tax=Roseovarius albus TaxID=1247867 RepID=A0A1X6YXJ5_9RHOB|nr:HesA/MoeB/ThiF family protein [Roseovarius albus]SLN34266.1 Molybdopterin-synthase adenylyltransferase [Roseovarius albus]